jgi:hypothetical protein
MTARCSRGAALSGARVFCWIDTKLAQLRRAHIQLPLAELLDRSLELMVSLASRGTGQHEQSDRGTLQFFLVAHVITEPGLFSSMRAIRS